MFVSGVVCTKNGCVRVYDCLCVYSLNTLLFFSHFHCTITPTNQQLEVPKCVPTFRDGTAIHTHTHVQVILIFDGQITMVVGLSCGLG